MNERIDRIADQIMSEFHDVFGHGDVVVPDEFFERFAELIVRDCACVSTDMWGEGQLPAEWAGRVQRRILAHFGVEE